MNLYLRLILFLIALPFRPKITDMTEVSRLRFHVWPNDLDFNMHMNNGRYLTVMDIGRFDLMTRSGLFREAMRRKFAAVIGAVKIRYRIPLLPFQAYDLETRILGWDDKWVYMEQRFIILKGPRAGAVAAIALVKGGVFDPAGRRTVPTPEMLGYMNMGGQTSPEIPAYARRWIEAEEALRDVTRN